jgi:hypothetical protein
MKLRYLHPVTFKNLKGDTINFAQLNELAKSMKLKDFAANKSRFLQFPSYADTNLRVQNSKEFKGDFEDYDFLCFLLPLCDPTLLIIDYDEPQGYNIAKETFAEFCLAHKSQKGGHIWLNLGENAPQIKAAITQRRDVGGKTARGKVDYFFGGDAGLIYTSFNLANNYYINETPALHPDNLEPLPPAMLGALIEEYENLVGANIGKGRSLLTPKPQQIPPQVRADFANKYQPHLRDSVGEFIYQTITAGKINLNDFKMLYNTEHRDCENARKVGSRTLTLHSIKAWAASCGFIEKWEDLERFMWIVKDEFCPNYDKKRFKKEVCNLKRIAKDYFLASEWQAFKAYFKDEFAFVNLPSVCVARNERGKQPVNRYIICDQDEGIFLYRGKDAAIYYLQRRGLKEQLIEIKNKDGKVIGEDLNAQKIPAMQIEDIYTDAELISYDDKNKRHCLNLQVLGLNPKIAEILRQHHTDSELQELRAWFDKSELETLFKENWVPEADIRLKFQGDLGYHLRTGKNLTHMMTLQDIGNTGKTQILKEILLRYLFMGEPITRRAKDDDDTQNAFTRANSRIFGEETAHQIATSSFTAWKNYRALIIDEDGSKINAQGKSIESDFYERMKGFIKSPVINIHPKGINAYSRPNNAWAVRFTNNTSAISTQIGAQNRFYFSHGQKNIILADPKSVRRYFPHLNNTDELIAKIRADLPRYLAYFLLIAPEREGYAGFENIYRYDTISEGEDSIDEIYETHRNNPRDFFNALLSYVIDDSGTLSIKRATTLMQYSTPQDKYATLFGRDTIALQTMGFILNKIGVRDYGDFYQQTGGMALLGVINDFRLDIGILPENFTNEPTIKVASFVNFFIKEFYGENAEVPFADKIYNATREAMRTICYDKITRGSTKSARIVLKGVKE